jgi:O-antigen/teichoic acid export membrane protein
MSQLRSALGYSAIESIGSRVFDLAILWIVLNSLPEADIAKFGLATASIFFFNLIFFGPETALLRNQKGWDKCGELSAYLSAFISFSILKLCIHLVLIVCLFSTLDGSHWLVYAVVFSVITQQIQLSEISRIYMRMDLQQRFVARFELSSKFILASACLILFEAGSIETYFAIYYVWSLVVSVLWIRLLSQQQGLQFTGVRTSIGLIWKASIGFSFWTHISGVLTYYIYNVNILFLGAVGASTEDVSLYTVISKVANLFFVIPMFFQSFVPVILSNSGDSSEQKFRKLLLSNAGLSLGQFFFFVVLGLWIGPFFGLKDETRVWDFYYLGLVISSGVLVLNLSRPLSTYLLIKTSPSKVMTQVFIPSAIVASMLYAIGSIYFGILGCAVGAALAYTFLGVMLGIKFIKYRKDSMLNFMERS